MTAAMLLAAVTMAAQEAADKAADKMDKKDKSVTGCIQAGTSPGTYMLTNAQPAMTDATAAKAEMGSIMLSASDVDLAAHVGHKVTVSGTMSGKMKHGDMPKDDKAASSDAAGAMPTLKVKSVTMVSTSCS
jgi:nickel-dependent lactate racemase